MSEDFFTEDFAACALLRVLHPEPTLDACKGGNVGFLLRYTCAEDQRGGKQPEGLTRRGISQTRGDEIRPFPVGRSG